MISTNPAAATQVNPGSAVNLMVAVAPVASTCVSTLTVRAKAAIPGVPGNLQLYWSNMWRSAFPVDHYNVYRSLNAGFTNSTMLAGAFSSPQVPAVMVPASTGGSLVLIDGAVVAGTTSYYRVASAVAGDVEVCVSNQVQATALAGR